MNALFVHDHPFIKDNSTDLIYTTGNLNAELWLRYLQHFDELTVIGRCKSEANTTKYNLATRDKVTFKLFDNVKGGADYFTKQTLIKKRLAEEIDRHDVVIIRLPATIGVFAADYCISNNKKYIVEVVGCSWDSNWNYGGLAAKAIALYSYMKMKKAVKHAFAAVYVTERFLQNRYPTQAKITTNASNVILKDIQADALDKRIERIKNGSSDIHLGVIGNLSVRYKGYDVLLKAVNDITDKELKDQIKISFVGGGDQAYLKSQIKLYNLEKQTQIIGKLKPGKEIFEFLDALSIYVHPSKQEGLPRVVLEAMSRACPVLASSIAGTPEIISAKYLHNPGDDKKLGNALVDIAHDKEQLIAMAQENFQNSKKYFFDVLEEKRFDFFSKVKKALT